MRLALLAPLSALPLMLAACSQEAAEEAETPVAEAAPMANATLDLQATGIIIPAQNGIEELAAPFGSGREATEITLSNVLGEMTERSENSECGAGPMQMTQYEGLTLLFQDDAFVGYSATSPYVDSMANRAEMLADPNVALVEDSTLGEEFTIGTGEAIISGVFSGPEDDARVTMLWAGANCVFR